MLCSVLISPSPNDPGKTRLFLPKLLFISPVFPLPLDRGQRVRIFNLLKACSDAFEVTFVSSPGLFKDESEEILQLKHAGVKFEAIDPSPKRYAARTLIKASLQAGELILRRRMQDIGPYREVLATLNLADFELIFVERGHLTVLAAGHYDRTIVDLDDLEHVRLWREINHVGNMAYSVKAIPRLLRLFIRETIGLRRFRAAIVCSEADRRRLSSFGATNVVVVPNGTQISSDEEPTIVPSRNAVFLGNCDYSPNRDAITLLTNEIIPILRKENPDFCVDLIGPHSDASEFQRPGVNGRGFVTDLALELAHYKVMVAPLRLGGGTKVKILDAMAAGVPVVTTSIGAEGLNLRSGTHALIADNTHDFANHVRRLLCDLPLRKKLAQNAQAHVRDNLSWVSIRRKMADEILK